MNRQPHTHFSHPSLHLLIGTRRKAGLLIALTALVGLGACSHATHSADTAVPTRVHMASAKPQRASVANERPKLVVFLVVDGLPQRQVLAYRDQLAPDGFARFFDRGTWYADAHYTHAFTVTAAGHATMLTGATPSRTGIIGNDWRDPATGAGVYNTQDPSATYIGHSTRPTDGTSPRNLKAPTVGDVLRETDARAKVIAISGKDRGAILPAGHKGTAYMYMSGTGQFASTTYYMTKHPAWVEAFNASKAADQWFKKDWAPVLPEAAYARSLPDGQPWYAAPDAKLPMTMGAGDEPGARYYQSLLASPFADRLSLEFAKAAIAGEGLGQDAVPDILSVSLSGHDYVNHAYSAESRFSHDHFLQLDRMLQEFFAHLDRVVGQGNYVAMLTADHGFIPAPEVSAAKGLDAQRLPVAAIVAPVEQALNAAYGPGKWLHGLSASTVLLNKALLAERRVDTADAAKVVKEALLKIPGIGAAYTRQELESGAVAGQPYAAAMRAGHHPEVSGDVQLVVKPHWLIGASRGSTHGSPHAVDTHVPILVYAPGRLLAGRVDQRVHVLDIAPTLAQWLQVPAPGMSEGKSLPSPR